MLRMPDEINLIAELATLAQICENLSKDIALLRHELMNFYGENVVLYTESDVMEDEP